MLGKVGGMTLKFDMNVFMMTLNIDMVYMFDMTLNLIWR